MGAHNAPIEGAKRGDLWRSEPESLTIIEDPNDPLFDHRTMKAITPLFIASISGGIIENVICIKRGALVIVVAGKRRVTAARLVNIQRAKDGEAPMRVPYTLLPPGTSDADAVRVMTKENGQRLQETPLGKGRKAVVSLRLGHTMEEVAEDSNSTPTAVGQWLKVLAEGAPEVIAAIDDNKIKFTAGFTIVSGAKDKDWSKEDQVVALRALLDGKSEPASEPETDVSGEGESAKPKKAKKKGITAREAKAKAAGVAMLPGQRHLKKLVKAHAAGELKAEFSDDVWMILEWLTGGLRTERIAGMTKALREVGFGG